MHRKREVRERIEQDLVDKYRACRESDPDRLVIHFPKHDPHRVGKELIAAELDQVEPRWRRLYVLYPTESSLRERGE